MTEDPDRRVMPGMRSRPSKWNFRRWIGSAHLRRLRFFLWRQDLKMKISATWSIWRGKPVILGNRQDYRYIRKMLNAMKKNGEI